MGRECGRGALGGDREGGVGAHSTGRGSGNGNFGKSLQWLRGVDLARVGVARSKG